MLLSFPPRALCARLLAGGLTALILNLAWPARPA